MKPFLFVPAAVLLVLLATTALGQAIVDVKPYTPPPDGQGRAEERIGERGSGELSGLPPARSPGGSRPASRGIDGKISGAPRGGCASRTPASGPTPRSSGPSPTVTGAIRLVRHIVNVRIVDGVSVNEIDQTFHNSYRRPMEGIYECPLPKKAIVNRFSIYMGGKEVRGKVVEIGLGRATYNSIVRKMRDPGLAELIEGKSPKVRVRIFPIPARGTMRVTLSYAHVQDRVAGRYVTRVPLRSITTKKHPTVDRVAFTVKARSSWPMDAVTAGIYSLRGPADDGRLSWNGSFKARKFAPKGDLKIRCRSSRGRPGLALHLHHAPDGTRTFMAVVVSGRSDLEKPTLSIRGVETENVYPCELETLPRGRQLLIFGRIRGRGAPVARLVARSGHLPVDLSVKRSNVTDIRTTAFISGMWAQGRIEEILGKRKYADLRPGERKEILTLSTRHGILNPLTAILAK